MCILDAAARRSRANRASCKHGPSVVLSAQKRSRAHPRDRFRDPRPRPSDHRLLLPSAICALEEHCQINLRTSRSTRRGLYYLYEPMKLRWAAAACVAPLAQGFVPARTAAARTAVVVRSEPIEINAPTVYSHWSANVNEEVVFPASLKNVLAAEDDIVTLPKGETSRKIPRAAA